MEKRGLARVSAREAAGARDGDAPAGAGYRGASRRCSRASGPSPSCEGVGAPAPTGEAVAFGLSRGRGAGRLTIDSALAHRIVALALGGPSRAPTVGRLGLGERGIVAGFVAGVLHALDAPVSVSLAAPGLAGSMRRRTGARADDVVPFVVEVEVAGTSGWANVELPAAWLATLPATVERLGPLPVEARLELACTLLPAGVLAGLAPGDAVVFDGETPFEPTSDEPRAVRVAVGVHAASARRAPDGRVQLTGDFRRVGALGDSDPSEESIMEGRAVGERKAEGKTEGMNDGTNDARIDATAVLAAAPIEVVAELGRLTLRGDEVVGLGPGSVLTFGRVAGPIALRVGGELWAEGEPVDVEGELGVRVTATVRPGLPRR